MKEDQNNTQGGHTAWKRLMASLNSDGDTLRPHLLKGMGIEAPDKNARRKAQREALDRLNWGSTFLREEVREVGEKISFYCSDGPEDLNQWAERWASTNSTELCDDLRRYAPNLFHILKVILEPITAKLRGKEQKLHPGSLIALFGIMCYRQQKKKVNSFQLAVGVLAHSSSVKISFIELLYKFGLCVSRTTLQETVKKSQELGKIAINNIGQSPSSIVAYDNLEKNQTVKEQRLESNDKFMSVTTGYVIQGIPSPHFDYFTKALTIDMMDYSKPLQLSQVLEAPGTRHDQSAALVS